MFFKSYSTETHDILTIFGIKFKFKRKRARKRLRKIRNTLLGSKGDKIIQIIEKNPAQLNNLLKIATTPSAQLNVLLQQASLLAEPQIDRLEIDNKIDNLKESGIRPSSKELQDTVISLCARPAHIYDLHLTLHSLLTQKTKPTHIILWLPKENFPSGKSDLPKKVLNLQQFGLEIRECEDYGYLTNIIQALKHYPNARIATAEDYLYYPEYWLSDLIKISGIFAGCAVAHTAWTIENTKENLQSSPKWKKNAITAIPSYRHYPLAEHGIFYPDGLQESSFPSQEECMVLSQAECNAYIWASLMQQNIKTSCTHTTASDVSYINPSRDYIQQKRKEQESSICVKDTLDCQVDILEKVSTSEIVTHQVKQTQLARHVAEQAKRFNKPIRVAFTIWEPAFWKSEALFAAMKKHPLFCPAFWIQDMPGINNPRVKREKRNLAREYAVSHKHEYFESSNLVELREKFHPDYIFPVQPYDSDVPFTIEQLLTELPCMLPYAYCTVVDPWVYTGHKVQGFYRYYVESYEIKLEASPHMANGGKNLHALGLPLAEQMQIKRPESAWPERALNKKKIIWAPHWTINNLGPVISVSCFYEIADAMLELARKYSDKVHFAFKPHPRLIRSLYESPSWGLQKAQAYYEEWRTGNNTQLEVGEYTALFQQSDAMIHDSSSFIKEYLLVNKPCLYLQRNDAKANFNNSTLQALKCYQKGKSIDDIEDFVQQIINEKDGMKQIREQYIETYLLPSNTFPTNNIINDLLTS